MILYTGLYTKVDGDYIVAKRIPDASILTLYVKVYLL